MKKKRQLRSRSALIVHRDLPRLSINPPRWLFRLFKKLCEDLGRHVAPISLGYIKASAVRKLVPQLVSIAYLGYADLENRVAYVVQSDKGQDYTRATMVHEFLHIILESTHPWPWEEGRTDV